MPDEAKRVDGITLMQKLINDGNAAVDGMLAGIVATHGDHLTRPSPPALARWPW